MDFIDLLKQYASRAEKLYSQIQTEEATKTSLIMPFFQQILGYDVFNPDEFIPEFTADVGTKQGEKVDYAICMNGEPVILVEAKWCGERLDKHANQLLRYFGTRNAKFGILTNGIIYKFFTDLETKNRMDTKPFLEIDIFDIKEAQVAELKKFQKNNFDIDAIANSAAELKYTNEFKSTFSRELHSPSDEFVRFFLTDTYEGLKTQVVIDKFRPILKRALNQFISDTMNQKIKDALSSSNDSKSEFEIVVEEDTVVEIESKIVTTEIEIEAFYAIKSILIDVIEDIENISYRDTETYFAVLYKDMVTKWICRLYFGASRNQIVIPDTDKNPVKYNFDSVNDIYGLKEQLVSSAERFVKKPSTV